jgi:hypothetical protein
MMAERSRPKDYGLDWEVLHAPEFDQFEHAHEEGEEVDNGSRLSQHHFRCFNLQMLLMAMDRDTSKKRPLASRSTKTVKVRMQFIPSRGSSYQVPAESLVLLGTISRWEIRAGQWEVRRVNRWPSPSQLITIEV